MVLMNQYLSYPLYLAYFQAFVIDALDFNKDCFIRITLFYIFFLLTIITPIGVRIGLFTPDKAFDMVCSLQISKLKPPSLKLVELVSAELLSITKNTTEKVTSPHPGLLMAGSHQAWLQF
jgi:hypothetical protein